MLTTLTLVIVALELPQIIYGRYVFIQSRSPWVITTVAALLLFYTAAVSQHAETKFIYFQF